ncbi:MAG: hypothetical protein ACXWP4_01945, partial [Polyangiales bacterium]
MTAALLSERGLTAMKEGRFLDAAKLYEQAAATAHGEGDLALMRGCAVMAVEAYAGQNDGPNALRVARATVDTLRGGPAASEIDGFRSRAVTKLRRQGANVEAEQLVAYVDQVLAAANGPQLPNFCSECGTPANAAQVARRSDGTAYC